MKKRFVIFTALMLVSLCNISWAGDDAPEAGYNLGNVIVSATKTEIYQSETGSSTTVITADELKKKGARTVIDVLQGVPGVSIVQNGSFGGSTSLYLRGTKPGHTLVMMDGIELNDSMLTDRSFDLAHLLIENIERIEIVRGAQSTLYGSDAMGGVINIVTKKGEGKPKWEAAFEGGSHNTFQETLGVGGAFDTLNYALSFQRLDTDGISQAANGAEEDSYENTAFSARAGYAVSDNATLDVVVRRISAVYDYDDGANQDDPDETGWWDSFTGKISFDHAVNPAWDHMLSFSYAETERKYRDDPDLVDAWDDTHNWFKGENKKFEWQHNVYPVDWSKTTAGFEYEEERGFGDGRNWWDRFDRKTMDTRGYYFQNQFKFFETLFITPGIRTDDNQFFGTETTYKISGSWLYSETGTRLKANWGTGFKAPSLYQLYSSYGDLNLQPDEGKTYDIGFEQSVLGDTVSFGASYFHNKFKNMVDFDMVSYMYQNIDNAKMQGWELECLFRPVENFSVGVNYTYTDTEDEDTGKELVRRSKNQAGLSMNWACVEKVNLNVSANYLGRRWDNAANTTKVKPSARVDVCASYEVTENFRVFGRVENLFDKACTQVHGYAGTGRSFYAGVKAVF